MSSYPIDVSTSIRRFWNFRKLPRAFRPVRCPDTYVLSLFLSVSNYISSHDLPTHTGTALSRSYTCEPSCTWYESRRDRNLRHVQLKCQGKTLSGSDSNTVSSSHRIRVGHFGCSGYAILYPRRGGTTHGTVQTTSTVRKDRTKYRTVHQRWLHGWYQTCHSVSAVWRVRKSLTGRYEVKRRHASASSRWSVCRKVTVFKIRREGRTDRCVYFWKGKFSSGSHGKCDQGLTRWVLSRRWCDGSGWWWCGVHWWVW